MNHLNFPIFIKYNNSHHIYTVTFTEGVCVCVFEPRIILSKSIFCSTLNIRQVYSYDQYTFTNKEQPLYALSTFRTQPAIKRNGVFVLCVHAACGVCNV